MTHRLPLLLLLPALAGCGSEGGGTPIVPPVTIAPAAATHLDELLNHMEGGSLRRNEIDWRAFRVDVLATAGTARTIPETYPAIRRAIELLRDGHTFYRSADGATVISVPLRPCTAPNISRPTLPADVGYVRVTSFGGTAAEGIAFAAAIQDSIRSYDRQGTRGWIVDLRNNGGGNMWPMIAGLGPLLGEGVLGYFIDPIGSATSWSYTDGSSILGGQVATRVERPHRLSQPAPRVAVLIDNRTASSGEATAISFKARPDTRFFGTATCGVSTANSTMPLANGAQLFLTTSVMADRARRAYGEQVQPDVSVEGVEAQVARAVQWIRTGE